jgi:hypothetical protein
LPDSRIIIDTTANAVEDDMIETVCCAVTIAAEQLGVLDLFRSFLLLVSEQVGVGSMLEYRIKGRGIVGLL